MPEGLTLAQRFHFDAYGYVLLENVLTPAEVARMKSALYRMKADPDPGTAASLHPPARRPLHALRPPRRV